MRKLTSSFVAACLTLILISCGGGGGGSGTGPVPSTLTFPIQSGMRASDKQGHSINFTVSGTCSGTASIVGSTPVPATFGTVTGFSIVNTVNINLPNCNPSYLYSTSTDYYDSNYDPLGTIYSSGEYGVYHTPPTMPVSVKVGDTGTIGTKKYYSDSSQTVQTSYDVISYVIDEWLR